MTAFLAIVARYWQAFAAIGAALGVLLYGRHQRGQGAAERETALRQQANTNQTEAMTNASQAAARVRDADPVERDSLRDKWTRP